MGPPFCGEEQGMQKIIRLLLIVVFLALAGAAWYFIDDGSGGKGGTAMETVTDGTGEKVSIPVHPKRVVILNPSNVDLFVAAGGADKIVGKPTTHSLSKETAEAVKNVKEVGMIHQPSQETILSLSPDLVIGVNVPYHVQLRESLAKAGIPLYINVLDSYDDVVRTLDFYGKLSDTEKEAAASLTKLKAAHDDALKLGEGKTGPKTLILFRTPQGSSMATDKSFAGDILKQLGGQNIADGAGKATGAYVPMSTEYAIRQNPEVLFIISMGNTEEQLKQFTDELKADEAWNGIDAVKKGRLYVLPNELFTVNPGMRIGDAMKFMARGLYGNGADE